MYRHRSLRMIEWFLLFGFLLGCSLPSASITTEPSNPTPVSQLPSTEEPTQAAPQLLYPIFQDDKAGFIDGSGQIVIQPFYENAKSFSEGLAAVQLNGLWGYIESDGEMVIQPAFTTASDFHNGRARVKVDDKFGFIDPSGTTVIAVEYDDAADFSEGVAKVLKCTEQKTCTWINLNFEWGSISYPMGGEPGYIDPAGNQVISAAFDSTSSFHGGLAAVKSGDRWGYIDTKGALVIQPQFDAANDFSEGLAAVRVGEKWGYIDSSGKIVIQPQFEAGSKFSEGLAAFPQNEQYGFIDASGTVVIAPQFASAGEFHQGLAPVKVGELWGYIDARGALVIPAQFSSSGDFAEGIASVWVASQDGGLQNAFINQKGEFITAVASASLPVPSATIEPAADTAIPTTAPAENVSAFTIVVDAVSSTWIDTGITIQKNDEIKIEVSGSVDFGGVQSGPDGSTDLEPGLGVLPTAPYGALLGKIGSGEPFIVGSLYQSTAQSDGVLLLLVNDVPDQYNDNSGEFVATITITRG